MYKVHLSYCTFVLEALRVTAETFLDLRDIKQWRLETSFHPSDKTIRQHPGRAI